VIQIPSNLVVARVGVRRWLSFLLLGWGTVASCMSLINTPGTFFALRLLLGTFEAGAVPAMWYHLSTFYPADRCGGASSTVLCRLTGSL
jgi:MFS family permease